MRFFYFCFLLCRKVSSNSNSFSNVLLKVSSKIKTDSCKLTYYPSAELKSTTPNPLPGSSTLKYNDSDTNVILVDGQTSENSYFQPQRDDTGSLQYIVSDVLAFVKHWIKKIGAGWRSILRLRRRAKECIKILQLLNIKAQLYEFSFHIIVYG